MVLEPSVEDEVVGERAEEEVEGGRAELREDQNRDDLAIDVVAIPTRGRIGDVRLGGQQPGIGLVQNERIEKFESDIHGGLIG